MSADRAGHPVPGWLVRSGGQTAVLILACLLAVVIGFGAREACWAGAWSVGVEPFQAHCYSDIYPLYYSEGLAAGQVPYLDHHVEYPVLIGAVMEGAALVVRPIASEAERGQGFYDVTVMILGLFLIAGVLATSYCAGPARRWTGLLVALAPALVLSAFINWDLIAMALSMLALAAWAARRPVVAGLLLGLAVATKFYPIVWLLPLFVLCLRAGRLREFWQATAAAVAVWLAINLPIAITAPSGWATFYVFNASRGADWGSIWFFFQTEHWPLVGSLTIPGINLTSALLMLAACVGIAVLAFTAPVRPRLPQLLLLITAAFLLTNKVWSPQYVIWLVPLVVLARPRLGGYLIWQAAEVGYFYAVWAYLIFVFAGPHTSGAIGPALYFAALLARFGAVALLCALVVRDILRPEHDIVRSPGTDDDPAGGVLDGAADRVVLALRS